MNKRFPAGILATAVLPWSENDELEEDRFRKQLRFLFRGLTPYVYLFGTAGEGYAVTDRQFEQIVHIFHDEEQLGDAQGFIGLISLSLATTIARIEIARDLGLRRFQLALPSWGVLNDREVDLFFLQTCGRFADCEFMHYNVGRSGRLLTGKDYARLALKHPNFVAAKLSGRDLAFLRDCLTEAPSLQFFITDPGFSMIRDEFECGLLASLALCHLPMAKRFYASRGRELQEFAEDIHRMHQTICEAVGGQSHMDGAYDKLIYRLHDPHFPLRLLPPYLGPDENAFCFFRDHLPIRWRLNNQI